MVAAAQAPRPRVHRHHRPHARPGHDAAPTRPSCASRSPRSGAQPDAARHPRARRRRGEHQQGRHARHRRRGAGRARRRRHRRALPLQPARAPSRRGASSAPWRTRTPTSSSTRPAAGSATREPYDVDIDAIIAAAKRTGTVLEIDAYPERLDLKDEHVRKAVAAGVPLVIDSDAHSVAPPALSGRLRHLDRPPRLGDRGGRHQHAAGGGVSGATEGSLVAGCWSLVGDRTRNT